MITKSTLFIKILLVPIFMVTLFENANAQLEGGFEQELPSPTAMSFAEVVDIPINFFTGQPNITVPLHSMMYYDIQIPINLTYSTTGLKVEDVSSYVGQGWDLNIGGVITRVTNGLPDESTFGYMNNIGDEFDSFHDHDIGEFYRFHHIKSFVGNIGSTKDYEQDVFYYNFLGRTGKFLLGNDENFYTESFDNIKINLTGSNNFEIIIENGTKFVFSAKEQSINNAELDDFITSWYLTEIIRPDVSDKIELHYSSYNYNKTRNKPSYKYYPGITTGERPQDDRNGVHTSYYINVKLDSIVSKGEKVELKYSERLSGTNEELQIDSIKVSLNKKEFLKYEFNYTSLTYRSYLDSVTKLVNSNEIPFYKFEYLTMIDPNPLYKGVDHWGYYNGKGNAYLTPFIIRSGQLYDGANRLVDKNNIIKGTLQKVEYPTGGFDILEYEPNVCQPNSLLGQGLQQPNELLINSGMFNSDSVSNLVSFDTNTGTFKAELVEITFQYDLDDYSEEIYVKLDNNRIGTLEPDDTPTQFPYSYSTVYQSFNSISSGTHSLEVDFGGSSLNNGTISYTIKIYQSQTDKKYCSGLRIKSISSNDGIHSDLKTRDFKYETSDGVFTSGISYGGLGYTYDYPPVYDKDSTTVMHPSYPYSFTAVEAYPSTTLGVGFSILTGYKRVVVEYSDGSYTENEYTTDLSNLPPTQFDANHYWIGPGYLSLASAQYSIGSPIKISYYNNANQLISSTEFEYKNHESSSDPRVKQRFQQFKYIKYDDKLIRFAFYSNYVVWRHLEKKTTRIYNGSGQFSESSVKYHYDDLDTKLLSYEELTNSNGEKRIIRYKYAFEIYNGTGEMEDLNMLSQPYSVTVEDDSLNVLSKNWTLWKVWSDGKWRPCETRVWKGGTITNPTTCTSN